MRNILGRLLAVAIGASNQVFSSKSEARKAVTQQWREHCEKLGLGDIICDTDGAPVVSTSVYKDKWQEGWNVWKNDICQRLTKKERYRSYRNQNDGIQEVAFQHANSFFWDNFPMEQSTTKTIVQNGSGMAPELVKLHNHTVPYTGVILDAVSAMPHISRLRLIITDYLAKMGFNLVQLRLVSNYGFVFDSVTQPDLGHSLISGPDNPLYSLDPDLTGLVESATRVGIDIMPEISVSSDAGGWYKSGLLANCPHVFCEGKGIPNNINDKKLLPVLFSIIGELRGVFTSRFFHLGTDERKESKPCFDEAKMEVDFDAFERKLELLMSLSDIDPQNILRTENKEGIHYSQRTGQVTQYRPGTRGGIRPDEPFFMTIDILHGDAFTVYNSTKAAVALDPLGIMAELRKLTTKNFQQLQIPKRLLAFAMGVSDIGSLWSIPDPVAFAKYFERLCKALELDEDCSPPVLIDKHMSVITETQEFANTTCQIRTMDGEKHFPKVVKPFYESEIALDQR
jgi:hypothetical protein